MILINIGKRYMKVIVNDVMQFFILCTNLCIFSISYCSWSINLSWLSASENFCLLRTKNLIYGFLPDSVEAIFTSEVHNTEHLFNHYFPPKMCLIIQLERNSFCFHLQVFYTFHKAVICLQPDLLLMTFTKYYPSKSTLRILVSLHNLK